MFSKDDKGKEKVKDESKESKKDQQGFNLIQNKKLTEGLFLLKPSTH